MAFAQVHPLPEHNIFDIPNQNWCYDDIGLDLVTLDGSTGQANEITSLF